MSVDWRRYLRYVGTGVSSGAWWATIGPFCVGSELTRLGAPSKRPLSLSGYGDNYPVTELLGRLLAFRDQLRMARTVLILTRAVLICAIVLLFARILEALTGRPQTPLLPLLILAIVGWAIHLAWHHAILPFDVARLVDRRLQLNAQIATAVETTTQERLDLPLARTQVRVATNCLRELNPAAAIPVSSPGRDVRAIAAVASIYALILLGTRLGVNLPRPLQPIEAELARQARIQAQAPSPFITLDPSVAVLQPKSAPLLNRTASSAQVGGQLNALQQQLQSQQITVDEYQNQLKQVQKQIQSQAGQSLAAQEALNALATSLKDVSATQAISDSLMRGDYRKASSQLNDLSHELPQLSPDAKNQIAGRLDQAASQTAKTSSAMSKNAADASAALKSGDTSGAEQAIQSLAQSVDQAQQQIAAQSQLGQDLQNVQQQLSGQQPSQSNQSQSDRPNQGDQPDSTSPHGGQSSSPADPSGTRPGQDQSSANGAPDPAGNPSGTPSDGSGRATVRSSSAPIQSDLSGGSGGVGDQAGSNPLGPNSVLDVQGVKVTIAGQSNGNTAATTSAGDRSVPLTAGNDDTLNGLPSSGAVPSDVPINVHQDSNVVPLDRKPVVRDYFSDAPQ
jgi:hypothetical protein